MTGPSCEKVWNISFYDIGITPTQCIWLYKLWGEDSCGIRNLENFVTVVLLYFFYCVVYTLDNTSDFYALETLQASVWYKTLE